MVCDLKGEWDYLWVGRGLFREGRLQDVIKITQQGNSFEEIRMIGSKFTSKGTVAIEGELDKNGFKKLTFAGVTFHYIGGPGSTNPKWKISKDGNTIEFTESMAYDAGITRR